MGGNARTTAFLKDCMADALFELLRERELSEVTVDDIVREAGVGRTTYFRHFGSKRALVVHKMTRLWEDYAAAHGVRETRRFDLANADAFFDYNFGIRDTLRLVYARGLRGELFDTFSAIMMPTSGDAAATYREKFYSYGLFGLLDEWVARDFAETPAQMADALRRLVTGP